MDSLEAAKKLLETILNALDVTVDSIELEPILFGHQLQVQCDKEAEAKLIKPYTTFREIENKLNEILQSHFPDTERIRLDCNGHRNQEEKALEKKVQTAIEELKTKQAVVNLPAMNAYHRRMVYHWLESKPDIQGISEEKPARLKQITLQLKSCELK